MQHAWSTVCPPLKCPELCWLVTTGTSLYKARSSQCVFPCPESSGSVWPQEQPHPSSPALPKAARTSISQGTSCRADNNHTVRAEMMRPAPGTQTVTHGLLLPRHINAAFPTHKYFKCEGRTMRFPLIKKQSSSLQRYACMKLCWQINHCGPQARGGRTIALPQFTCWILFCPAAWSGVKGSCSEAGSRQWNKGRENTSQPKGTAGKLVIGPCVFGFRRASRFVFPRLEPGLKETWNY